MGSATLDESGEAGQGKGVVRRLACGAKRPPSRARLSAARVTCLSVGIAMEEVESSLIRYSRSPAWRSRRRRGRRWKGDLARRPLVEATTAWL